jgi:hypothetical protein
MMTIQDEGHHLADMLEDGVEQGGLTLSPADCELAAKALRWFAVIAERLTERVQEEDEVYPARESAAPLGRRLH